MSDNNDLTGGDDLVIDDILPRYTGNTIVLFTQDLSLDEINSKLRDLSTAEPEQSPDIFKVPEGPALARVYLRPDVVVPPAAMSESRDAPKLLFERERWLYITSPPTLESDLETLDAEEAQLAAVEMTWNLKEIGIRPESRTGKDVSIAVLDTGLDRGHPDFKGRVVNDDFVSFIGGTADDLDGHGTHSAGVACGPLNPKGGIRYGVAPDARLIIAKVSEDNQLRRSFDYALGAGMLWARTRGADIISISLGFQQPPCNPPSRIFNWLTSYLLRRGTIVVQAAGNSSRRSRNEFRPIHHTGDSLSVVAIAALNKKRRVANFSCGSVCKQRPPSFAAPGVDILSALIVSADPPILYRSRNGTSSATPMVAGMAALWIEHTGLRGAKLLQHLTGQVAPLGDPIKDVGLGMLLVP